MSFEQDRSSLEQNSDEAKESLIPKEAQAEGLKVEFAKLQGSQKRLKRVIRWLSITLALVSFGLVAACVALKLDNWHHDAPWSPVPSMPIVPVKFERDERYAGGLSDENDQAWAELTPAGDGFIVVNDPGKYNLPPGQDIESGGQMYDISMFHQLHCLFQIRNHYYLWQGSIGRNNSKEIQEQLLGPQEDHVHHCFDYIRQALMCAGDMTVEWPREEEDGRRFAVDGWGVTHQCKSWDAIMSFMKENDIQNAYL